MPEENKSEEKKEMNMDDVKAFLKGHAKDRKSFDKLMDEMRPAEDAEEGETEIKDKACDEETKEKPGDEQKAKDEAEEKEKAAKDAEEKEKTKTGMDAMDARIAGLEKDMFKTMAKKLAERDKLAREVAAVSGTFDHAEKTTEEVLIHGLASVGLKAPKGQEKATWDGFMAGRKASGAGVTLAFDKKNSTTDGLVNKTLAKCS